MGPASFGLNRVVVTSIKRLADLEYKLAIFCQLEKKKFFVHKIFPSHYIHYKIVRESIVHAFMDPLRTNDSNGNADLTQTLQAIMQQLSGISTALQAQERRLGQLETARGPPTTAFREPETSHTGGEASGTPPQERSAQGAGIRGMESLIQQFLRGNNREETPVYQQDVNRGP